MRLRRRWTVGFAESLLVWLLASSAAGEPSARPADAAKHAADAVKHEVAPHVLALHAHVASEQGAPAASEAFIDKQLTRANEVFAQYGVRFVQTGRSELPAGHAHMRSRADRDALGEYVRPGVINAFFVAELMDVDEPGRVRRGVHWRSRSHRPAHYVIVSAISFDEVLAHELGHFLGNRRHSPTPGNLMSYARRPGLPFLDTAQVTRMRMRIGALLESGELLPPGAVEKAKR